MCLRSQILMSLVAAVLLAVPCASQCPQTVDLLRQGKIPDSFQVTGCAEALPPELKEQLRSSIAAALTDKDKDKLTRLAHLINQIHTAYSNSATHRRATVGSALAEILSDPKILELGHHRASSVNAAGIDSLLALLRSLPQEAPSDPLERVRPLEKEIDEQKATLSKEVEIWKNNFNTVSWYVLGLSILSIITLLCVILLTVWARLAHSKVKGTVASLRHRVYDPDVFNGIVRRAESFVTHRFKPQIESLQNVPQQVELQGQQILALRNELNQLSQRLAASPPAGEQNAPDRDHPHTDDGSARDSRLQQALSSLHARIGTLERGLNDARPAVGDLKIESLIVLELEVLAAAWKRFAESNKDLSRSADSILREEDTNGLYRKLLVDLPALVANDEDLRAAGESAVAPVREFQALVSRISLIPKEIEGSLPNPDTPVKKLLRIRESSHLLSILLGSSLLLDKMHFRLDKWAGERFLSYADLFLKKYQDARREGRDATLEPGRTIVLQTLALAGLEPLDIVLGQTPFDSGKHVGRSTTNRPDMPDGTIASVVRNGFLHADGTVWRQPEVIVNRL